MRHEKGTHVNCTTAMLMFDTQSVTC